MNLSLKNELVAEAAGWPHHRENREFGYQFFPDRENTRNSSATQEKFGQHRKKWIISSLILGLGDLPGLW